eukprot:TRINITY_DN6067_c0_g1_i11.p1 TRINITY_DN6067_c0_g1~~TRINITY_DN6067_c0_g1_i11.p1  ORF type:complete len:484 (-),score=54.82 TRINITY_DN6067_c0_g1_i11:1311-2549(-)
MTSSVNDPRGLFVDSTNTLLISDGGRILGMKDVNNDGLFSDDERWVVASAPGLNHGITVHDGYLYASSDTTVFRWAYTDGSRSPLGTSQTVLNGMPTGGHGTRTIVFDSEGALYISVGSLANVDPNSNRARVVKCALDFGANPPAMPYSWLLCSVWADGTRNEVGLRFDPLGRLWGVENGVDNLNRVDMGGNIKQTNPGEEINLFDRPGAFYGYPYCWSEGVLASSMAEGATAQWSMTSGGGSGMNSDVWCKNTSNVVKPKAVMPAHTAPLDLLFHTSPSFPVNFTKSLLISQHGSWNANPGVGSEVVSYDLDDDYHPLNPPRTLFATVVKGDQSSMRPVALAKLVPCGPFPECVVVSVNSLRAGSSLLALAHNNSSPFFGTSTSATTSSGSLSTGISTIGFLLLFVSMIYL